MRSGRRVDEITLCERTAQQRVQGRIPTAHVACAGYLAILHRRASSDAVRTAAFVSTGQVNHPHCSRWRGPGSA